MTVAATQAPVSSTTPSVRGQASTVSRVAWIPNREMSVAEWMHAGQRLGAMARCGQWGLGDWIRYGEARFGERYSRPAKITGYDVQSLMNMVYVASRFDISRRREDLSWSHHEAVASLEPHIQDYWLDRAIEDKLSVADLRGELRAARRSSEGISSADGAAPQEADAADSIVCPQCGCHIAVQSSAK